tara:strand:+ start:342 stop:986 length:645 start_codon:yes stop_codon:yes gene_type:complete
MSFFEWLTIFFVCLVGAMTPGPSLIVIIYITNSKNFISGFIASLAHGFGIFIYALISIFSLTVLENILPSTIPIIQLLGAIFLIYLGYKILFLKTSDQEVNNQTKLPKTILDDFVLGLTISLINPKILIFFTSIFSQFINQDYSIYTKLGMGLLAGIIDTAWYVLVSYSVSIKVIENYIRSRQRLIFLILGMFLIIFSFYLTFKATKYFILITN